MPHSIPPLSWCKEKNNLPNDKALKKGLGRGAKSFEKDARIETNANFQHKSRNPKKINFLRLLKF